MNDNQTMQPSQGPNHPFSISLPSRETTSDLQFGTVLSVLGALTPYLLLTQREIEGGIPTSVDGGAVASATATFAVACDRLDKMLNDSTRWGLETTDTLNTSVKEHFRGAVEVQKAQVQAVSDMRRPSSVHKPRLTTVAGEFIALWGDPTLPGGMILGRGLTPEAALVDFDLAFTRKVAEQLRFAPAATDTLKEMAEAAEREAQAASMLPDAEFAPEPQPGITMKKHKKKKSRKAGY